ncbi:hypothetical protein [Paraburkholderia tropica]|uniref:hypothetical protein n=1 Tax=Paraburkholderia tropica TaxID=92647 RepID=UPI002ABE639E|nr:hypothetical protein [Paraburkholderia tropica]
MQTNVTSSTEKNTKTTDAMYQYMVDCGFGIRHLDWLCLTLAMEYVYQPTPRFWRDFMRGSTRRLNTHIANAKVNGLQRVYIETSALLPAIAVTCGLEDGMVTEYLGDGCLTLFRVNKDDRVASVNPPTERQRTASAIVEPSSTRRSINATIFRQFP